MVFMTLCKQDTVKIQSSNLLHNFLINLYTKMVETAKKLDELMVASIAGKISKRDRIQNTCKLAT